MDIVENKIEELSCGETDVQAELYTAPVLSCLGTDLTQATYNTQTGEGAYNPQIQAVGTIRTGRDFTMGPKIIGVNVTYIQGGTGKEVGFVSSLSSISKEFPPIKIVGEETALKNMKEIEKCLMDDKVGKIGVFGMGGVGKTALMTQIYNKIKNTNTFARVIWVTVFRDSSCLEKLQDYVSKELDVDLSKDHGIDRTAKLFGVFKRMGRFLLILDDMWNAFPLKDIGIPEPNEENKCKIVWTTRSNIVCRWMGNHELIKMEVLTKDESWTLFQEKLGANVSPELEPVAKKVVEECGGLPLAIITVGAAMSGPKNDRNWRNALEELRNSRTEMTEGIEDKVFNKCLKFSFDKLKTPRLQDCFLYCALYPEDHGINCRELIEYWMADGLLNENEDHNKGLDEGYTIIDHLKDASMLQSGRFDGHVKMHDLLRDLAIIIIRENCTRENCTFVVKAGFREKHILLDENLMTGAVRVSLMSSNITETLSFQPESCAELSTLFLTYWPKLKDIHHLYFEHMHNLRVLDLSNIGIVCLPQSISNLKKLRCLSLNWCESLKKVPPLSDLEKLCFLSLECCKSLKKVPSLEKLKELRVLNLDGTKIKHLPEGLECLTNLRRLHLPRIKLDTFPAGVIRNLSCLEELYTGRNRWTWSSNENGAEACVEELLRLKHLRLLYANFDLNALNCYFRSGNLRDLRFFSFLISDKRSGDGVYIYDLSSRSVRIKNIKIWSSFVIPDNTLHLDVRRSTSGDMSPLSEIPSMRRLKQLTTCDLFDCAEMEYILAKDQKNPFLPTLNKLDVSVLRNLRSICKDLTPTESGSLASLKTIHIFRCSNLKFLFSVGWLQALQNLEKIWVYDCGLEMEELLVETEEDMGESSNNNDNAITLPRLRILNLSFLPKLKSISKRIFICNSLEEIIVKFCPNLKKLPLSIKSIPSSLKRIEGSNKWWDSLEWDNPDTQSHLQPFFEDSVVTVDTEEEEEDDDNTDAEGEDDDDDEDTDDDENTDVVVDDEDTDADEEDDENTDAEGEMMMMRMLML